MTISRQNDVLFVGMNKYSANETGALTKSGAKVTSVTDTKKDDQVTVGKGKDAKTFDLTTEQGRKDFVATLGLPKAQGEKIAEILKDASADSRDELAQVAQVWAEGEKGGDVPGRLVLS